VHYAIAEPIQAQSGTMVAYTTDTRIACQCVAVVNTPCG
jgi:hypothetical protein